MKNFLGQKKESPSQCQIENYLLLSLPCKMSIPTHVPTPISPIIFASYHTCLFIYHALAMFAITLILLSSCTFLLGHCIHVINISFLFLLSCMIIKRWLLIAYSSFHHAIAPIIVVKLLAILLLARLRRSLMHFLNTCAVIRVLAVF